MTEHQSYFTTEIGNPLYKEKQEEILNSIKVGTIDEVIPEDVYKVYEEKPELGQYEVSLQNNRAIIINNLENGISTIVILNYNADKRRLHSRLPDVEQYYFIDRITEKAWNVAQIWESPSSEKSNDEKGIHNTNLTRPKATESRVSSFFPDGLGGIMLISYKLANVPFLRFGLKQSQFFQIFGPIHEAGHKYQHHKTANKLEQPIHDIAGTFFINFIMSRIPRVAKIVQKIPIIKKYLEKEKYQTREVERNASAFALRAVRILRDQGLDITRGLPNSQVIQTIHGALESYNNTFKFVEGKAIVNPE